MTHPDDAPKTSIHPADMLVARHLTDDLYAGLEGVHTYKPDYPAIDRERAGILPPEPPSTEHYVPVTTEHTGISEANLALSTDEEKITLESLAKKTEDTKFGT